jgi:hypothetical protein
MPMRMRLCSSTIQVALIAVIRFLATRRQDAWGNIEKTAGTVPG